MGKKKKQKKMLSESVDKGACEATKTWKKVFGEEPETGYNFKRVSVDLMDLEKSRGFRIRWAASGIGFGELAIIWSSEQGFYTDTEYMGEEFVSALIKEATPQIVKIIIDNDYSKRGSDGA